MKKYISAGLTLILMVIWTVAGSLVSIAEKTDTVMQVKAVTTIALGDKAEGGNMTLCDSPVGITNIQGVEIGATEKVTNNAWSDSTTLNRYAEIQLNTSLAGAKALLVYFKMPKNSEYPNLYFCCGGANAEGAAKWCKIAKDNPYYVLEKSDPTRTWTERKATWDGGLELPADFDGFLYFPLPSLGYTPNDTINVLQFWLDTFGGDAGPGVFGGFMLATNAVRSSEVLLPGETISRDFFTGKYILKEEAPNPAYGGSAISLNEDALRMLFTLPVSGIHWTPGQDIDLSDPTIQMGDKAIPLVEFGAIFSNQDDVDMDMDHLDSRTVKVEVKRLIGYENNVAEYVMGIRNIPSTAKDATIFCRPYVMYFDGIQNVTVYGEVTSDSINAAKGRL